MKYILIIVLILAASTVLGQPGAYVVNNLAETLSRIDLETGHVRNHIVTLGETPNYVGLHGGYIYVLNSISANIQKIDPGNETIVADIPLPIGSNPYALCFDGAFAYVSGFVSGMVFRVNLASGQVQGELEIGGYPEGLTALNGRLYVAQTGFNPSDFSYGQGRIAVVDLSDFSLETEINVGKNPQAVVSAPDGKIHVVCTGNYVDIAGAVYVFDPVIMAVADSLLIGGQPSSAVISRQGIAYLGAGGWVDHGYIFSYNSYSLEVLRGPANPIETGLGAYSVALDSMGFLYSCDFGADTVTKLSSTGQNVASYGLGDGPQSIVILDDRTSGLDSDQYSGRVPEKYGLLKSYPNPFNGETLIEFKLPDYKGLVDMEIFDISGRIVRSLVSGTNNGAGSVLWDGRDLNGDFCASGIYFARVGSNSMAAVSGAGARALKLSLIK